MEVKHKWFTPSTIWSPGIKFSGQALWKVYLLSHLGSLSLEVSVEREALPRQT